MDYNDYYNKVASIAEKYADLLNVQIEEARKNFENDKATAEEIQLVQSGIRSLHDATVIVCRADALRKGEGTVKTGGL